MEEETLSTAARFDRKLQMKEYSRQRRLVAKQMPPEVQKELAAERAAIHKRKAIRKKFCDIKILSNWVSDATLAATLESYIKDGSYKTLNPTQMALLRNIAVRSKPGEECPVLE